MLRRKYEHKKFLLFGGLGLLVLVLALTAYFVFTSETFDERSRALSEVGIELNPSRGIISDEGLDIDLIIDTHGEEISGVEVTLEYTESIHYDSFIDGDIPNCKVEDVVQGDNRVNLFCFIPPESSAYQGSGDVFATASFRSTGSESAKIEVVEVYFAVRDSRREVEVLGSRGDYQVSSGVAVVLDSSSGIIPGEGKKIDLLVDTQGEDVSGIDVTFEYSGDIEYVGFEQGEIENCEVEETGSGSSRGLHCFISATQPTYKGKDDVFASVIFRAIGGDGQGEIDVTRVDYAVRDDRQEVNFTGGDGQYTTTLDVSDTQPSCGTLNNQTFAYQTTTWPQGTFCSEGVSEPTNPSFPGEGSKTSWSCVAGTEAVSCSAQRDAAPSAPPVSLSCGTLNGQIFAYETMTWPTGSFCLGGDVSPLNPEFPEPGSRVTWQCATSSESISCSASRYSTPLKDDGLPETSIFENTGILIGFVLVLISSILLVYKSRNGQETFSMRNKLSF